MRIATRTRNTTETQITGSLTIEGGGRAQVDTGIGFLDHMLQLFARHGGFDLSLKATGDLHVDQHHTVEDVGIVIGELFDAALGDRRGINRAGYWVQTMDETLVVVALDLGGRASCVYTDGIRAKTLGGLTVETVPDFFEGFARAVRGNVHVKVLYGRSSHHRLEAVFKGWARAMRYACSLDASLKDQLPSTKGLL
ncbi:MAG: imidazoleglycerol-phosphate dehydratase HisB [Chthonomonas sp.]|nr:imidazoleglycerol-phosphate dehydratase HisB [Chthonomonas sp.]